MARLRACCAARAPVGWVVTSPRCSLRVSCSMNTSAYSRLSSTVSISRKSQARIACAWAARNCRRLGPAWRGIDAGGVQDLPHPTSAGGAANNLDIGYHDDSFCYREGSPLAGVTLPQSLGGADYAQLPTGPEPGHGEQVDHRLPPLNPHRSDAIRPVYTYLGDWNFSAVSPETSRDC